MINFEYQNILRIKATKKVVIKEIRTCKRKEKEDIWAKQVAKLGPPIGWTTRKTAKKHVKVQFTTAWTLIAITKVGDHFLHDFQLGLQTDPCKYMEVNLGYTTWVQQQARLHA